MKQPRTKSPRAEHPVRVPGNSVVADTRETHPAYGMLSFNRVSGDPGVLYGSPLDRHADYVRMTLARSERLHNLSADWHMAEETLVEVDLTHAQFAELITTLNAGDGVTCTVRKLPGVNVPEIAVSETEQKRVQSDFKKRITEFAASGDAAMKKLDALLEKPNIGKGDRKEIREQFQEWLSMIESSAPFVLDQFQESVERTVTAAKAEVDGFITTAVTRAGLGALRERFGTGFDAPTPELPADAAPESDTKPQRGA